MITSKSMNPKYIIFIGMFIGSTLGSLIASGFGFDYLSLTSAFVSFAGGAIGVYVSYQLTR